MDAQILARRLASGCGPRARDAPLNMNSRTKQPHGPLACSISEPKRAAQTKVQGLLDGGFPYSRCAAAEHVLLLSLSNPKLTFSYV